MARVTQLRDESWVVSWTPSTPRHLPTHNCTTNFKINGRKHEFSLHFGYQNSVLTLTLTTSDPPPARKKRKQMNCNEKGGDLPVKIVAIVDGVTKEMKSVNERGKWCATIDSYQKFTDFYDPNYYCNHNPEVVVTLMIDFPVIDEKRVTKRLAKLFESGDMADVLFVVQGKDVKAHKNIVVSASPVMAAMFQSDNFTEGFTSRVEIDDIGFEVFNQLLLYMYTDAALLLKKDAITEKLFLAADKYQVEGLKEECVNCLISKLKLQNVVRFLVVGYLHTAPQLKEASLQWIEKNKNDVWERPEWKELMKNYPDLFYEACQRMLPKAAAKQ